jgi:hypothetical protein
LVLDTEKIKAFIEKIEAYPQMWNSLETTIAAYYKESKKEWICLAIVFYASEKSLNTEYKILYEIPNKFKIVRYLDDFSIDKLKRKINEMTSGSITINNTNILTTHFETIDSIKEKWPHWQREGLSDKEGWPAIFLRNYAKDNLLDPTEWVEIDELVKKHLSEPHRSLAKVTSKYLGMEVYGGKLGAIYGVIPIYLKLEEVKFRRDGELVVKIASHNSIKPSDLRLNVVFENSSNKTESLSKKLIKKQVINGNIWMINEIISNNINAIKASLFLIFNKEIVFEDWAKYEDLQRKNTTYENVSNNELIIKIERLQVVTTARATGKTVTNDDEYTQIRNELINNPKIKEKLPPFLSSCSTLGEFWIWIRPKYATYEERRKYIQSAFKPSLDFLEKDTTGNPESIKKITEKIPHIDENTQKMAEAYTILHLLENQLRNFIMEKLEEKYAGDWWEKAVSQKIRDSCADRKKKELDSPWHDVEKNHMIFYTTFEELHGIIQKNWNVFQPFFKDQNAAIGRLTELEIPRNTIAHNRVLQETELERLRLFSRDIFKCILP